MASGEVYEAIRSELTARWSATPIAFENELFDAPEPPAPWIMLEVSGTFYAQQSIGSDVQADNRWDEEGLLWLHVLVPSGTGTGLQRTLAKNLADVFRGLTLLEGALEFLDASIGMGELGDDSGNYWRVTVSVDWRRMEA